MASNSNTKNSGKGGVTTAVSAWYDSETGNTVRLCISTSVKGSSNGPWGYGVVGQSGYEGNGANWREVGRGVFNYANTVVNGTAYFTVGKPIADGLRAVGQSRGAKRLVDMAHTLPAMMFAVTYGSQQRLDTLFPTMPTVARALLRAKQNGMAKH